ncbi:MAG: cation diffusion facilitator family transporter [Actinomycetota bacterium]|jgi:cobalt-zinc-cadmium efflux system protein|nr:cation diffusion facilitator family transporter [Actinomycetota bacterium]MDA8358411.1 cation diffusion facilitator family transporter [Actinomycetota bacterium]
MGHDHGASTAAVAQRGRLTLVLGITVTVLAAEIIGGVLAHSLVLIADAGHMAADAAGMGLSLLAVWFAGRPTSETRTFGYQRGEILAAVVNAALLFGVGAFILIEAARRLAHPETSTPSLMLVFGIIALAGNAASLALLRRGQAESLNVRGAFLEVLSDLLGAAAVLVAAAVIAGTGFERADAVASILIGALILPRTVKLLRDAVDVLLEATPKHVDLNEVRDHIRETPGVLDVHDLHAWTITSGVPVLSAHVVAIDEVLADGGGARVLDRLAECMAGHFDVEHCTFQLEPASHRDHEHAAHP